MRDVSSWTPVDIASILAGNVAALEPTHFCRDDGAPLLYPGRVHSFYGEPESMKSWAAQLVATEVLMAGDIVLYIDCESEPRDVLGHLLALGVSEPMLVSSLLYVRPEESGFGNEVAMMLLPLGGPDNRLRLGAVIVDGVNSAIALGNGNPDKDPDVRAWSNELVRPLQKRCTGPVVLIDHVVKNRETRGDWASGSYAKKALIDGASYGFSVVTPFGRGRTGVVAINLHKDRPGAIRGMLTGAGKEVAQLQLASDADGTVTATVLAATSTSPERVQWRPTVLMARISEILEGVSDPISKASIERTAGGNRKYCRVALDELIKGGYVEAFAGPGGSIKHRSVKPFTEGQDDTSPDLARPRPTVDRGEGVQHLASSPPPLQGGRTGRAQTPAIHGQENLDLARSTGARVVAPVGGA